MPSYWFNAELVYTTGVVFGNVVTKKFIGMGQVNVASYPKYIVSLNQ